MRHDHLRWLIPSGAVVLALIAAAYLAVRPGGLPQLELRADLATVSVVMGVLLALIGWAALLVWCWGRHVGVRVARQQAIADHRRFLHRLDHELKNPLMAIRAATANLGTLVPIVAGEHHEGVTAATGQRVIADSIAGQVTRLGRLATDLRKLADLETTALERAPIDLAELLREVIGLVRERPGIGVCSLTLTLPQAPWPLSAISGDRDLLFLALYNLVDNALKFSGPEATIEVRAFEDGARVVVEVADTGPGIPADEIPFVWEELYRGQAARATPGSGLGLALVQAIVARHDAQIVLRSRFGHGTVVSVRLLVAAGGHGTVVTTL